MKVKIVVFSALTAISTCGLANAGPTTPPAPVHDFEVILTPDPQDDVIISPADNRNSLRTDADLIDSIDRNCASESLAEQVLCAW